MIELLHLGKYNLKILHIAEELTIILISHYLAMLVILKSWF